MLAMRRLILVLLAACATPAADQRMPPVPPPVDPTSVTAQLPQPTPQCLPTTKTAMVSSVTVPIPDGVTETNTLNAAVQALFNSKINIESKDVDAHLLVTKELPGQTLLSTCSINMYRSFKLRVSVVARSLYVSMDCHGSIGWEAQTNLPAHRGPIEACVDVSVGDAKIPQLLVDSVLLILNASYGTSTPQKASGWWCASAFDGQVTSCLSTRASCDQLRESAIRDGNAVAPCAHRDTASCYTVFAPGAGLVYQCSETDLECRANYAREKADKRATCVQQ